jgi:Mce-associated membrane protein
MSERDDENTVPSEPTAPGRPTPSPKAQAASRARRIGGRPQPGTSPRPTPGAKPTIETNDAADVPETAHAVAVVLDKSEKAGTSERATAADARKSRGAGTAKLAVEARKHAATAETDGETVPPMPRGPLPAWLNWLPAAVLAALIVLVLVLGVVASHGVWWAKKSNDTAAARQQVLASAKSCMATMNTYDYRKLDEAETKGLACTTGKFTAQYKTALDKLVKPQATKLKFTQAATVNNAGIESISKDGKQWVVLIFGQLSTTNSADGTTTPKLSIFSARVTMQPVKGHWLVANYEYAPSS